MRRPRPSRGRRRRRSGAPGSSRPSRPTSTPRSTSCRSRPRRLHPPPPPPPVPRPLQTDPLRGDERTMDLNNLSEAAPATPSAKATAAKPTPEPNAYEPLIHGESTYDRVTSMLISVVVGAGLIVGWLWLVFY